MPFINKTKLENYQNEIRVLYTEKVEELRSALAIKIGELQNTASMYESKLAGMQGLLESKASELKATVENHTKLSKQYRMLEKQHQALVLELGLHDLVIEVKPASPERTVLKKKKSSSV